MKFGRLVAVFPALPLAVMALPAPTPAPSALGFGGPYRRQLIPGISQSETETVRPRPSSSEEEEEPSTTTTTSRPVVSPPPTTTTTTTTPPTTTAPPTTTSTTSTPPPPPSTTQTEIKKTSVDDEGRTLIVTEIRTLVNTPTPSASTKDSGDDGSPGLSVPGIIGLSVAGGVAVLAAIAFIVWKMTNKRFSQFDNDDSDPISWDKEPPVVPTRPAPSVAPSTITSHSIDAPHDPYAVPPIPQGGVPMAYRDDPAGASGAGSYYDPYRGPVPQTFASPANSVDQHGEAIPMSTYNAARSTSPGPNMAYQDPYMRTGTPLGGARSTSPGPNRIGTPLGGPPRMGTPVQRMATPSYDIPRTGTPGQYYGGAPQQQPLPNPYGQNYGGYGQ